MSITQRQWHMHIFNQPLTDNIVHDALNSQMPTELKTTVINAVYYRYLCELFTLQQLNEHLQNEQFKKCLEQEKARGRDSRKLFNPEQNYNDDLLNQLHIFYSLFLLNTYYFASNNLYPFWILPYYRRFTMQKFDVLIRHLKRIATALVKFHLQLKRFF